MKTRFLALATAVFPLLGGCTSANSEPEPTVTNVVVQPVAATPAAAPVAANPLPETAVPAGEPVNTGVTPPATINLSPAATEITKLVQAGVDSTVILAYVTNSPNTFRLEASEIVYLNDLGVSSAVVTAMIQHDQRIREASLAGATVTSPSTPATSVWASGQVTASNVWQQEMTEPAPAAEPSTSTTVPPPPDEEQPSAETVNYFYDSLAPYGTWIDVDGYGRCWRPTVVVTTAGWRPYSHGGRWVWTDSGWYWYSDYSWGWAPFHYGRWFSHPRWGWCWVPGSVWGPSWVSWRYSDAYYGWAPLPPAAYYSPSFGFTYYGSSCGSSFSFGLTWDCFTFVSYNNFHHHRYDRHCVPHHQAGQVFNNTTVVNNIISGNNNTIINQGVAPTRITAASGTPIQQVAIREGRGPRGNQGTRREEMGSDGRTLQVVRASIPARQPHTTASANTSPTRGGAQNLTTGNAAVTSPSAPTAPQAGLVPAPLRSGGPRRTVPTRNESSAPTTPVARSAAAASAAPSVAAPAPATQVAPTAGGMRPTTREQTPTSAGGNTREGGPRRTVPTRIESSAPTTPVVQSSATASATPPTTATTVAPTVGGTRPPTRGQTPASVSANTRDEGTRGALIIRTPTPRPQNNNPVTAGNASASPVTTPAPTPAAPVARSTPVTPGADRSQATPWLNNTPAPARSQQLAEQSGGITRQGPARNDPRTGNSSTRQVAPSYVAPSAPAYQAPAYQAPAAPRVTEAPARTQPSQHYSPPARSSEPRYTPAPQAPPSRPAYTPPQRESAPSVSPPPSRSEPPRSEPRSESRGSSSSNSSKSGDDRSSRGR